MSEEELRNTAKLNQKNLKGSSIIASINNDTYAMQISGIGQKAIRLSLFVSYEDLLKYKNHRRLEHLLYDKITKVYQKNQKKVWRLK